MKFTMLEKTSETGVTAESVKETTAFIFGWPK